MTEVLKFNGKEYPYRVSFRALSGLQRDTKTKTLNEALVNLENIDTVVILLYHSLLQGHKDEGIKLTLKKDDCYDLLEDGNFTIFIESVGSFFLKMGGEEEQSQK
jgi:hypothetical protein